MTEAPQPRPLGRFAVATDTKALATFRRATGAADGDNSVPATFPITWIAEPKLANILNGYYEAIGSGRKLVLQTEQQFRYARPLAPDRQYVLDMVFEGPDGQDSYRLVGKVSDADGTHVLDMVSTFVFVTPKDSP